MAITFTQVEQDYLKALRTNAEQGAGYWRCYEYIAQRLEAKGVSLTDPALLWFKGAGGLQVGYCSNNTGTLLSAANEFSYVMAA